MRGQHDGLCEYISRFARVELISLLLENRASVKYLARDLSVSRTAVVKWLRLNGTHPSNANLRKIVVLAVQESGRKTFRILTEDLLAHRELLEELTRSILTKKSGG